jgi:hypothetical protein
MDPTDAVLLTIDAAGGSISGRTAIQKLIYFESCVLEICATYQPYYYGPYSAEVAGATQSLVSLNFLNEEIDYKESRKFKSHEDWKKYKYKISEDGNTVLKKIKDKYTSENLVVNQIVELCNRETGMDILKLSCAAKVHYLRENFTNTDKSQRSVNDMETLAGELGWQITEEDIFDALGFIKTLRAEISGI